MGNLKQRLGLVGKIVLGAIGIVTLSNVVGCAMTPAQNMAVGGTAADYAAQNDPSLSHRDSQGLSAFGVGLSILAHQEAMKEAAREGRTVIVMNNQYSYYNEIIPSIFSNVLHNKINDVYFPKKGYVWKYPNKLEDKGTIRKTGEIKDFEMTPKPWVDTENMKRIN